MHVVYRAVTSRTPSRKNRVWLKNVVSDRWSQAVAGVAHYRNAMTDFSSKHSAIFTNAAVADVARLQVVAPSDLSKLKSRVEPLSSIGDSNGFHWATVAIPQNGWP